MKRVGEINLRYLWHLKERKTKRSGMAEGKRVFGSRIVENLCLHPVSDLPRNEKSCLSSFVLLYSPLSAH